MGGTNNMWKKNAFLFRTPIVPKHQQPSWTFVQKPVLLKQKPTASLCWAVNRTYPGVFPLISWEGQIKEAFVIVVIESK